MRTFGKDTQCIHCGAPLRDGMMHYNAWLSNGRHVWECPLGAGGVPVCRQGAQWYVDNTVLVQGVRYYKTDPRVAGLRKNDDDPIYKIPHPLEIIEESCGS